MRRFRAAVAVLALGSALSGCWLQPGYDAGNSRWNPTETTVTAANADQLEEVWSYDTGGRVLELLSQGGQVVALANPPSGAFAASLDLDTGDPRWTYAKPVGSILYGVGLSNPVYVDGRIEAAWNTVTLRPFTVTAGGRIVIDAATGEELEFSSDPTAGVVTRLAFQLGVARGLTWTPPNQIDWLCDATGGGPTFAFVGLDLAWHAGTEARGSRGCDPATGQWASTWATDLGGTPVEVAAVGADAAAYLDSSGTLSLVDMTTGAIVWTAEVGTASGLTVADSRVIVRAATTSRLLAYAADTGALLWESPFTSDVSYAPAAGGDVVYLPVRSTSTNESAVVAYDLADGTQITSLPLGSTTGSGVFAGPIVDGGRVVVGTENGSVVAFGLPG